MSTSVLECTKEPYKAPNAPCKIEKVQFGLMSAQQIESAGEIAVYQGALYNLTDRTPFSHGPLDRRLGISSKSGICETCGQALADCTGHFGYIKLELPVFHIGYFRATITILQCICKTCSRVLLGEEDRRRHLKRLQNPHLERMQRHAAFAAVQKLCKRARLCPWCGAENGTVKKLTGALKIAHDVYSKNHDKFEQLAEELEDAMTKNEQIRAHLRQITDDLSPVRVLALFTAISADDCKLLDMRERPECLVVTHIPVPPVCIRPSVEMDSGQGSNEDDITVKLRDIVLYNNAVRQDLERGATVEHLVEHWDILQQNCAQYINSDLPGMPSTSQGVPIKPIKGFVQRLKGKQGRFRGNLSGKRVDFSGRTVISPDPNLRIDQVAVPRQVAQLLTYPERVTQHNLKRLQTAVRNGPKSWPGATAVVLPDGEFNLAFGDRDAIAKELAPGSCLVKRHLQDGDVVLFNRQPSLHRMSIMAHRARVMPWRTFRFNECVCSPYNADFDGDEMNLHVPQTEEARAEAAELMGVMHNLCTPKNGEILIAATQDFLTSAFLLTSKDRFYTRAEFTQLCAYMGDALDPVDLPVAAIIAPLELFTGKQLLGVLVRPNRRSRNIVNLETKEKIYTGGEAMCPQDGWVCFRNSELMCGRLGKATLGGGNKAGLFQVLTSDVSAKAAAGCMNRLAKLSARFIGNRGFSIGIDDVTPKEHLRVKKQEAVDKGYDEADTYIAKFHAGRLQLQQGCDMEQSLESLVTRTLNEVREAAAKVCMSTLHWHNSPLNMSQCGSKGSPINIAQMVACVGQQSVGGRRCPNGFKERTLPHFPRNDKSPGGKGFVANSFYSGLTPTEFFFHTMGGREGLVDTAVKTAETGYMSRRLMKALEDLYTHYDGTVRNAAGAIVQLTYGDDGLDPVAMEAKDGSPVDLSRALSHIRATAPRPEAAALETPAELGETLQQALTDSRMGDPEYCSSAFRDSVHTFVSEQIQEAAELQQRLGLDAAGGDAGAQRMAAEVAATLCLTRDQLRRLVGHCGDRVELKRMDPGSTVGAFGAQSIGEPGTQMTLKTFHFAGVASMNVTLGVPRIKEIINASKVISTPIMKVALENNKDERFARAVKARVEATRLTNVASLIKIGYDGLENFLLIRLDVGIIERLQLNITPDSVREALLAASKLKLKKEAHIKTDVGSDQIDPSIKIHSIRQASKEDVQKKLQRWLVAVPQVIVQGIPTVNRAVIKRDDKLHTFSLLVEGTNLLRVLATPGVAGTESWTNHIVEIERTLGIEAARSTIISEIKEVMGAFGMSIDTRHTMLLADCMTFRGELLGINRFGISRMKESVLMLASFEKTTDHLFDAALHGREDSINGVSESIIMGIPMPVGTGIMKLRQQHKVELPPLRPLPLLCSR